MRPQFRLIYLYLGGNHEENTLRYLTDGFYTADDQPVAEDIEFAGMYVIVDFTSDAAPVFYNPETNAEIAFAYAITSEGEAIYSIVSGSAHNGLSVVETCGWDNTQTYRLMAVDKFYIPVPPAENSTGELRGTLSGAINASFPDLKVAGGKLNDVVYIEQIVE